MRQRRGDTGHGRVDWDLLADHLGGALAGTPEETRVAELTTRDPAWLDAAEQLSRGMEAAAADLRELPEPRMPDDVTDRLDAALRQASQRRASTGSPATTVEPRRPVAPVARRSSHLTRPAGSGQPATGSSRTGSAPGRPPARPGRPRRGSRLMRWSTSLAAAAGLMTLTVVGLSNWSERPPPVADRGEDSPAMAPESLSDAPAGSGADPLLTASGMDYSEQVLTESVETVGEPSVSGGQIDTGDDPPEQRVDGALPASLPPALSRLWSDPPARELCLGAVATTFAPTAVTVHSIDFARYQGRPALVMWLMTGDGTGWVSVSGPACGTQAAGADLLLQSRLR